MLFEHIIRLLNKPFSTAAIIEREARDAERVIALFEQAESFLNGLANLYHDVGRFADAERCLREVAIRSPRNAQALSRLAYICARQAHWDDAVAIAACALLYDGNNYLAHWTRGKALIETGRNEEAIEAFKQAVWLEDNDANVHDLLARAHRALGHQEESDFHQSRALALREAADK